MIFAAAWGQSALQALAEPIDGFDLKVDFAALAPLAKRDILRVFEPHEPVTFDELKASLEMIRRLWS